MRVDNTHAVILFARQIAQDVRDLRRDLASDSLDSETINAMLDGIERKANLAEAGCESIAESLRNLAG